MRVFIREQTSGSSPPIMMHIGVRQVGHEVQHADFSLREVEEKCETFLMENVMKSIAKNGARNELHKVKDKTEKRLQQPMRDPTLEGRDENKVGRIPEKLASVD